MSASAPDRIERASEAMQDFVDDHIAQLHNPVLLSSWARRQEIIVLALVMVKERETPQAYWASTDGNAANAKSFPKSIIRILRSECDGQFVLATMKGWVAIERHLAQGYMPTLTKTVKWTEEQREGWRNIQREIPRVRERLRDQNLGRRRRRLPHGIGGGWNA